MSAIEVQGGPPVPGAGRALVVEDTPEIADLIELALRRAGLESEIVTDGLRAVERAAAAPAELILLDVSLPGLDGIEACRRIRAFSDARIAMLSGSTREADRERAAAAGADAFWTKPFSPRQLTERLRSLRRAG